MKPPSPNILDKAIAIFSPERAARRLHARTVLALAGGYTGASFTRPALARWNPRAADADGDASADLATLRGRARDLARNSPLATGAINGTVTQVVGTGLSLQPSPNGRRLGLDDEAVTAWSDATLDEFKLWAESLDCDITRKQNFYGLQALAFRSTLESGDGLAVLPDLETPRSPYRLKVQLIEADRLCNPEFKANSGNLVDGCELDGYGATSIFHICNQHPGSSRVRSGFKWTSVPAIGDVTGRPNVLHLMDRKRPGQTRGVPILAPVIEPLKQLQRYTDAELQAAVVSGMFAVFLKMDPDAFGDMFDQDGKKAYLNSAMQWDGTLNGADLDGGGKAINLLPGEEAEGFNPGRPNALFDPFVQAIIRQVGVALEIPFEVLIKHFSSSYSAARAALLDAWRFYRGRRDWLATYFCQPIYETWLAEAVSLGRVAAPGFFADPAIRKAWCDAEWVGDGPGSIDPLKEVSAAEKRIALGVSTVSRESVAYDGVDWRIKHKQRIVEVEERRAAGLEAELPDSSPPGPLDPGADPNADPGADPSQDIPPSQ